MSQPLATLRNGEGFQIERNRRVNDVVIVDLRETLKVGFSRLGSEIE